MFLLVRYGFHLLFNIFFSDASDNEHCWLVEIKIKHSTFECDFQKKRSKIITIKKIRCFEE